jgi:hypothetical protein
LRGLVPSAELLRPMELVETPCMPGYSIVTMAGDGIGNRVLPDALRVLGAVGLGAEVPPRRYWLGALDQ